MEHLGRRGAALLDWWYVVPNSLSNYQDAVASEAYLPTRCNPPC